MGHRDTYQGDPAAEGAAAARRDAHVARLLTPHTLPDEGIIVWIDGESIMSIEIGDAERAYASGTRFRDSEQAVEVTEISLAFLDRVNAHYGTTFTPEDFGGCLHGHDPDSDRECVECAIERADWLLDAQREGVL